MGPRHSHRSGRLASGGAIAVRPRARSVVSGVLLGCIVLASIGVPAVVLPVVAPTSTLLPSAMADPMPAETDRDAAALAGGWLARQVTASLSLIHI